MNFFIPLLLISTSAAIHISSPKDVGFEHLSSITRISDDDVKTNYLNCMNCHRKCHGASPLVIDNKLQAFAQNYAESMASSGSFGHNPDNTEFGENIYQGLITTGFEPCEAFYSENMGYNYNSENNDLAKGHFTQMVWKSSERVGIGMAQYRNGLQGFVVNFDPPGNYIGYYVRNVGKPQCSSSVSCS